jgi:hypothetical protein
VGGPPPPQKKIGRKWNETFSFCAFFVNQHFSRRVVVVVEKMKMGSILFTFEREWAAGGAGENRFRCTLDGRGDARRT